MDRSAQLETVIDALSQLVKVLANDPQCQWHRHFENCLRHAGDLKGHGFDQASLNDLSGSIRCVFHGMGSFNDYAPVTLEADGSFRVIPGMESLDPAAGLVHERALSLMVVGKL